MSGYPDYAGTPPVTGDTTVISVSGQTLAEGAGKTFTAAAVRPGYNIFVSAYNATNNTVSLPVGVQMTWTDQATGLTMEVQEWYFFAGESASPHQILGHGPTNGDMVAIDIVNLASSAVTLNYSLTLIESGRTYDSHDWRTNTSLLPVYPGWTAATADLAPNIVAAEFNASVGASGILNLALPLYAGSAMIYVQSSQADGGVAILPLSDPDLNSSFNSYIFAQSATPGRLYLPRAQCIAQLQNGAAAAANMVLGITAG